VKSGKKVAALTVAYGREASSLFIDVDLWLNDSKLEGLLPKVAEKKGYVLVKGELRQDKWEAKDGTKRSRIKILADDVSISYSVYNNKNAENSSTTSSSAPTPAPKKTKKPVPPPVVDDEDDEDTGFDAEVDEDDIPF